MKKTKKSGAHPKKASQKPKPKRAVESQQRSQAETQQVESLLPDEGAQLPVTESVDSMSPKMQRQYIQRVSDILGNRRASQLVASIQRHPGHGKPEESDIPSMMRSPDEAEKSSLIMRAEMLPESTEIATVNADSAPLDLNSHPPGPLFDDSRVLHGQLAAGDQVRILCNSV